MGVLATSALVALGIVVFGASFVGRSSAEIVAQRAISGPTETSKEEAVPDCSGASAADYACHQKRYQDLVRGFGVESAFEVLKDESKKNEFVESNCHQLTHVIGRTAAELYGDIASTYAQGDYFCMSGYYHGAMEGVVAKIGADKILDEADTICADLRENQGYSLEHRACAHGLGHGFMGIQESELFESLRACEVLPDRWERGHCYSGVFMENVMAQDNPSHPSKYLKADQPLYPCTDVETKYKNRCYEWQARYALKTQDNDFAKVFDLCSTEAEVDARSMCYWGLGREAAVQSISQNTGDDIRNESTRNLCMLGEDHEARSNCVIGALEHFIRQYSTDVARAKRFCEFLSADLRTDCTKAFDPD